VLEAIFALCNYLAKNQGSQLNLNIFFMRITPLDTIQQIYGILCLNTDTVDIKKNLIMLAFKSMIYTSV
jgi:hypothetical protein